MVALRSRLIRRAPMIWAGFLLVLLSCCGASAEDVQPYPLGWVRVIPDSRIDSDTDEVVGWLFENGVSPKELTWLKPTYGNQNILWFLSTRGVGERMFESLRAAAETDPTITVATQRSGQCDWSSARHAPTQSSFEREVLVADAHEGGDVVVLYWGTEAGRFMTDRTGVLAQLAHYCS